MALADIVLVRKNPLDVVTILELSRATYRKMIQDLLWATGYNVVAIPAAAGALFAWGVLLTPALGAASMRRRRGSNRPCMQGKNRRGRCPLDRSLLSMSVA